MCICVCVCCRETKQREGEAFLPMCVKLWKSEFSANYWFWKRLSLRWWGGVSCEVPIMWNQLPLLDSVCSIFIASSSLKQLRLHLLMRPLHSNSPVYRTHQCLNIVCRCILHDCSSSKLNYNKCVVFSWPVARFKVSWTGAVDFIYFFNC